MRREGNAISSSNEIKTKRIAELIVNYVTKNSRAADTADGIHLCWLPGLDHRVSLELVRTPLIISSNVAVWNAFKVRHRQRVRRCVERETL
jgi:hypothetical protein